MTAPLIPKFSITFDIVANTLAFTDISSNRGATTLGIVKITHVTSGTIIHQHTSWAVVNPNNWVTPEIHGDGTPAWTVTGIALPPVPAGDYLIEYRTAENAGVTAVLTTRSYTLNYVSPVVVIDMTVLCSTSQLVSTDNTDYTVNGITPTITYAHTIVAPAGSSYTGTLGTTNARTRTIGGGSTAGTRLWTREWQTVEVTTLSYAMATWGTDTATVFISDVVSGNDEIFAQCSATICALATCFANLHNRWLASLTTNFTYRDEKRDTVIACLGLWEELNKAERCGYATESIITQLQTLLAGENCQCTTESNTASVPIVPWAAITGTGGVTPSPHYPFLLIPSTQFQVTFVASDPQPGDGNNGDVAYQTTSGYVFQKVAGAWVNNGLYKGVKGDPGDPTAQTMKTLISDIALYPTPASTTPTALSYELAVTNELFTWEGDFLQFDYEVKLARNVNGKKINLYYNSNSLLEYFIDDLVTADNDILFVGLKMTRVNNILQDLTVTVRRSGDPETATITKSYSMDLTTAKAVVLFGTSAVGIAGDIIGYSTIIRQYHRETTLIAGGSISGSTPLSQTIVATEGQTDFVVTDFTASDYFIPMIDYVAQNPLILTRVGQTYTYATGLHVGQTLTIIRTFLPA